MDEAEIHTLLTAAAEPPGGPIIAPVEELLGRAHADRRRRRARAGGLIALALAAVVAVPAALATSLRGPADAPATRAPDTTAASVAALAHGRWTELPEAPIPPRSLAATAWTGREMLVWGGQITRGANSLRADGAAYDPATGRWRVLPPAPLTPRADMAQVWTGREWIVWGGHDGLEPAAPRVTADGAAYNPATDTWRSLPPAPLSARADAVAVWTGREVVVIGGHPAYVTADAPADVDAAAYDPATDRWRALPAPALPAGHLPNFLAATATGDAIYAWVAWTKVEKYGTAFGIDPLRYSTLIDAWTTPATTGKAPDGLGDPLWTGDGVLVPATPPFFPRGGPMVVGLRGSMLDPGTGAWQSIAHGPVDDLYAQSVWTGAALLSFNTRTEISGGPEGHVWPGAAAAWDPQQDRWTRLPAAPLAGADAAAVWTGTHVLLWGELYDAHNPGSVHGGGLSFG